MMSEDGLIRLLEEEKEGTLIQCLDDGFIRLVDYMASDADVVQAARTSYGKGTKTVSDDRGPDPVSDAALAYHAVRDVRVQIPRPLPDGLLATMGAPSHGVH
jgi:hypothetical protein